ncbi:MAG: hypothetical protein L0212_07805 [Acidobacteria bacterium]|nr:hypothetical protein [Acidobacteriota bacterium]
MKAYLVCARSLTLRHFYPLLGFLIPTLIVAYGVVIPRSCIAGVNEQTVGFAMALLGAAIAYSQGILFACCTRKPTSVGRDETP